MKYNLEIAKDMFKEQGLTLLEEEYKNSHTRMFCVDDDGYKYSVSITQLLSKNGNRKFDKLNPYTIDNIKNYIRLNDIESELLSTEYKNNTTNLKFLCKCGEEFETSWASFLRGKHYCFKCQKTIANNIYRQDMIKQAKQEFADRGYTLITDEYLDVEQMMEFKCNLHPEVGVQTTSWHNFHHNGSGCKVCARQIVTDAHRLSEDEIKTLTENRGFIYVGHYYQDMGDNHNKLMIKYICPQHDDYVIQEMSLASMRKEERFGCPRCKATSMEFKIIDLLNEWGIDYVYQMRFSDCKDIKSLPFDFYLPDYKFAIEYDGEQHYMPIKRSSCVDGVDLFESTKKHDEIKNDFCKRNNIYLLRIPYWEQVNIECILFDSFVEHGILEVA